MCRGCKVENGKIGKLKIYSDKQLKRLNRKANKTYELNQCPKCGEDVEHSGYNYVGECFESYSICRKCNLHITHFFDWKETEIVVYKKGDV